MNLLTNNLNENLTMNNQELIRTLNKGDILAVVELLAFALKYPNDDQA